MGSEKFISENQSNVAAKSAWVKPVFELLQKDLIEVGSSTGQPETPVVGHHDHSYYS